MGCGASKKSNELLAAIHEENALLRRQLEIISETQREISHRLSQGGGEIITHSSTLGHPGQARRGLTSTVSPSLVARDGGTAAAAVIGAGGIGGGGVISTVSSSSSPYPPHGSTSSSPLSAPVPHGWRIVRFFISSTNSDMHAERDVIVRSVFPKLNDLYAPARIRLVAIDLRWGMTLEMTAGNATAVQSHLLDVIDSTMLPGEEALGPRMLIIRGQRYGWVQPFSSYSAFTRADHVRRWLQPLKREGRNVSLTHMECLHGVLGYREPLPLGRPPRCFAYLRDPSFATDLPPEQRWIFDFDYCDPSAASHLPEGVRDNYSFSPDAAVYLQQSQDLLESLRTCPRVRCFEYTCEFESIEVEGQLLRDHVDDRVDHEHQEAADGGNNNNNDDKNDNDSSDNDSNDGKDDGKSRGATTKKKKKGKMAAIGRVKGLQALASRLFSDVSECVAHDFPTPEATVATAGAIDDDAERHEKRLAALAQHYTGRGDIVTALVDIACGRSPARPTIEAIADHGKKEKKTGSVPKQKDSLDQVVVFVAGPRRSRVTDATDVLSSAAVRIARDPHAVSVVHYAVASRQSQDGALVIARFVTHLSTVLGIADAMGDGPGGKNGGDPAQVGIMEATAIESADQKTVDVSSLLDRWRKVCLEAKSQRQRIVLVIDGLRLITDPCQGETLAECLVRGAKGCPITFLMGYHPKKKEKKTEAAAKPATKIPATAKGNKAEKGGGKNGGDGIAPVPPLKPTSSISKVARNIGKARVGGGDMGMAHVAADALLTAPGTDAKDDGQEDDDDGQNENGSNNDDNDNDENNERQAEWCAIPSALSEEGACLLRLGDIDREDAADIVRRYLGTVHKSLWEKHPTHGDQMEIVLGKPQWHNPRYLLQLAELATMCGSFSGLSDFLRGAPDSVRGIKNALVHLRRSDYVLAQDHFDVSKWLDGLGLGSYAASFRAAHVDTKAQCASLTDAVLRDEIGVPAGHRVLLLNAIKTINHGSRTQFGYDCFVSYRVSTDADIASKIALLLKNGDVEVKGETGTAQRRVKVFLDVFELKLAEDWEKGFMRGLRESLLFVPILSDASMRSIAAMAAEGKKDNVLLEFELAIARKMNVMPLLLGSIDGGGLYREFSAFDTSIFPDAPSQTSEVPVRRTMAEILKKQGVKVNPRDLSNVISKVNGTIKSLLDSLENEAQGGT